MQLFMRDVQEMDVNGIMQVHQDCIQILCSTHYAEDVVKKWLDAEHDYLSWIRSAIHFLVVADAEDRILAFAYAGKLSPEVDSSNMDFEIHKLYVSPCLKGRGVGRKLLAELERRVSNDGGSGIAVKSSLNAVRFYEACGFKYTQPEMERTVLVGEASLHYKVLEKLFSTI